MNHALLLVTLGIGSFVCALLLVPLAQRVALLYGVTDKPAAHKLHADPTPYLGGVAIGLTALAASAFLESWSVQAAVIILGALLVGTVGLIDDVRTVRPSIRLVVEAGAAIMAAAVGARVHLFGGPADWVVTVVCLVIVTNAFNLLDNMDGAVGIIAAVSAVALTVAAGLQDQWLVGGLAAVVAGSCVGFLRYNWHPARIFMGDAGSLLLGYLLATIALKLRFPVDHPASLSAVVLLLGAALFDTTLVVIARVRSGRRIYMGATDHTSHRLLRLGLSTRAVACLLATGCIASTALGVAIGRGAIDPQWALPPLIVVVVGLLVALLRLPDGVSSETQPEDDPLRGNVELTAEVGSA